MATDARPEISRFTKTLLDFSSRASRSLFPGLKQLSEEVSSKSSKKRKRQSPNAKFDSSQNSSVADSLSTPASQSPPLSENDEGERQQQYPSVLQVKNSKRPRLGRHYQKGMRVTKHFPGEGWYVGEITKYRWCHAELQYIYRVEYEADREREIMTEEQIACVINQDEVDDSVYPFEVFNTLWEKLDPESIEKSSLIRKANNYFEIKETRTKFNAQYGRMLPGSTDMIFQIMRLRRDDLFMDIGHGIGNSCLQAAYTRGCEARGIEIIPSRFEAGLRFQEGLQEMALQRDALDGKIRHIGKVDFKLGDLSHDKYHNWIVKANKVFVNNFNGVFAERSSRSATEWHLDHYIGGLFASMAEGSVMVTLSDMKLGPSQSEANKWRVENGLNPSPNASFFEVKKVLLGEAGQVFSWSTSCKTPAYAFVYKRVKQDPSLRGAVLLCSNKDCENAVKGTPVPATAINQLGKCVVGSCGCKMSLRSNRRIPHMKFYDFIDDDFI